MTQKISFLKLSQRVTKRGWELLTTEQQWLKLDTKSDISVRSPQTFEQQRPVSAFAPNRFPPSCLYSRKIRKGETIMVLIASKLLGVDMLREHTPLCLEEVMYRLDAYAVLQGGPKGNVQLAMEHQGDHRRNPKAPIHFHKGGALASMAYLQRTDAHKALLLQEAGIVLVEVPDLLQATKTISGAVLLVAQALEDSLDFLVHDAAYRQRKQDLCAGVIAINFPKSWEDDARMRVESALNASGDADKLFFVSADPLSRLVTLRCQEHGLLPSTNLNNVLGSVDGLRIGTRCPHCANVQRSQSQRLPLAKVQAAATRAGFAPLFEAELYQNNQQVLPWQCLKDPGHLVQDSLAHLSERGCQHCRQEARDLTRGIDEFSQVAAIIEARGDTMLSPRGDYLNQRSLLRYRCCLCEKDAKQTGVKVKLGQRHDCQRLSASHDTRRQAEFLKFQDYCALSGVTLLATPEQYHGNRYPLPYQLSGDPVTRIAAPYLIKQHIKAAQTSATC